MPEFIQQRTGFERACEDVDKNNERVEESAQKLAENEAENIAKDFAKYKVYQPISIVVPELPYKKKGEQK